MRTQEELLPLNEPDSLRLHPDELELLFAVGADWPDVLWRFLNIKFLRHNLSPLPKAKRSHAGPLTLDWNRDTLPALADAFG
jgi:hypothetical protein